MLNIFYIGLISFFTDISTEMVYPLIPLYLASAFGATPALIGVIEGIAESAASLMKAYGGYVSDKLRKRKAVAFAGYFSGVIYKLALLFAGSWGWVLFARVVDRLGKGVRVAPRNALVTESADKDRLGRAFGMHKMLDAAGAAVGILITFFFLRYSAGDFEYKRIFLISLIPAAVGLSMFGLIKEKKPAGEKQAASISLKYLLGSFRTLDGNLKLYLLVVLLFTLGNSSNAFLLLKASAVGYSDSGVVLLYFLHHASASAVSVPFGGLSDKVGRKKLLVAGYLVFAASYFGFAFAAGKGLLVGVFVLYGAYTAIITGVERAFISDIAPQELMGTMHGLHATIQGTALLPASVITGALWVAFGPVVPFVYGAGLALAAALVLLAFLKPTRKGAASQP